MTFLLFLSGSAFSGAQSLTANKGVLDLRGWNWQRDGLVPLHGEWAFYWQELRRPDTFPARAKPTAYVAIPDVWNGHVPGPWYQRGKGYATYRLRVMLPKDMPPLALKYMTAATAMEVYANGRLLVQQGKVGTSPETMTPAYKPGYVLLPVQADTLDLVVHISNYHYFQGGLWDTLTLGPADTIRNQWMSNINRDFFVLGCLVLVGLYHLCVYFFMRHAKAVLLFACFCFLIAVRVLVTGELIVNLLMPWSWQASVHAEFLAFYLGVPVVAAFSHHLFPDEFSRRALRLIVGVSAVFVLAVLVLPPYAFTHTLRPFQLVLLPCLVYGVVAYVRARRHRKEGSGYFLAGFVVFGLCVVNDILYTAFVIHTMHLFYVGLFVLIFSLAIMLSKRFSMAFYHLQNANQELELMNEEMQAKSEEIYRQNEQLLHLNNELDSLVYRVSHDLRSPVASVMGLIDISRFEEDPKEIMHYMDLQEKTLHRMDSLIQDIIDYSKNKRTDLLLESIDLQTFTDDIIADHSHLENASLIEITVRINQPSEFVSDKRRLSIVLSNLVSNAIRYHDMAKPKPKISVSAQTIANQALVEIRDNGQGIGAEHVGRVFEMFYRANETTKGSGLGLYLVKEAVEKMGGNIRVESQLGKGTMFLIMLPNLK